MVAPSVLFSCVFSGHMVEIVLQLFHFLYILMVFVYHVSSAFLIDVVAYCSRVSLARNPHQTLADFSITLTHLQYISCSFASSSTWATADSLLSSTYEINSARAIDSAYL